MTAYVEGRVFNVRRAPILAWLTSADARNMEADIRNGDVVHPMERELVDLISKARKAELSWTTNSIIPSKAVSSNRLRKSSA